MQLYKEKETIAKSEYSAAMSAYQAKKGAVMSAKSASGTAAGKHPQAPSGEELKMETEP